jgi:Transcriptional activator of glycolytic enzymes
MKLALDTEECPLDAKLDHVIPGLKEWHAANNQAVVHLDRKVDAKFQRVEDMLVAGFGNLSSKADRQELLLRRRLAGHLMSMANGLLQEEGTGDTEEFITDEDIEEIMNETPNPAQEPTGTCTGVPLRHRASSVVGTIDPVSDAPATAFKHIHLTPKHTSLSDLWDEWYGLGHYTQVEGGINWLETKYKNKWRPHLEGNQFSRTKRVIQAINEMSGPDMPVEEVIAERSQDFLDCQCSVGVLVEYWKTKNYITKKAARGRKAKQAMQQQRQQ